LNARLNSGFYGASSFGPCYDSVCTSVVQPQGFDGGTVVAATPDVPVAPPEPQTPPVPQPFAGAGTARITVILPTADAKLWIDDYLSQRTGVERTLVTPELEPGGKYAYSITAMWTQDGQPITRARDVTFVAGQEVVIDFTVPQPRRVDQE
jgi:uncharacterized protein (TIGR03000 family)